MHRDTESLTLSAAQTHTANVMGVKLPGFEVFCITSVDLIRMPVLCT